MKPQFVVDDQIDVEVRERVLEPIVYGISEAINPPQAMYRVRFAADAGREFGKMLVARLERDVYAEKVEERTCLTKYEHEVPATWWDMLKRDVLFRKAPWLRKRLAPVCTRYERGSVGYQLRVYAMFPGYVPPNGVGQPVRIQELSEPEWPRY